MPNSKTANFDAVNPCLDETQDDCACVQTLNQDDVIPTEISNNENRIVFASLYSYADNKDESAFKKIYLPIICVPTLDLFNMFYINKRLVFSPYVLNALIGSVKKAPLIEQILLSYEESSGNDRNKLTAQQKILIRQELSTQKINNRIQRIVHLNYDEFQEAFDDTEMWFDQVDAIDSQDAVGTPGSPGYVAPVIGQAGAHKNFSSVEINMYSDSLQMGFILVVQFVSWAEEPTGWPTVYSPPLVEYDMMTPSGSNSLNCGMCLTYEPEPSNE
jgi:hypothetical protein